MSEASADDQWDEIEAKLEILRQRAKAYQDFIAPEGQPPLLWQMAMLADAGFTILPRVDDPDPDRSFPEMHVEMRPLQWSSRHFCLIGGEEFRVMCVPDDYGGHVLLPKRVRASYVSTDSSKLPPASMAYDVEHYRSKQFALNAHGRRVWSARIMVCESS